MLIFNESEYAKSLISNGFAKFMSLRDLSILAKYYRAQGKGFRQIEKELIEFCKKYNPEFNEVKNSYVIKKAIATAKNYKLRMPKEVIVTKSEIEKIRTLKNYKYEKILFVMLVIAKYFKNGVRIKQAKQPKLWGYYVNTKMGDVLKLAGVRANKEERNKILYELAQLGFVEATYTGGLRVCYADDNSEPKIVVSNFDDIASFYPPYCPDCFGPVPKYFKRCPDCYEKNRKEQMRANSKKYRERKKE